MAQFWKQIEAKKLLILQLQAVESMIWLAVKIQLSACWPALNDTVGDDLLIDAYIKKYVTESIDLFLNEIQTGKNVVITIN